MVFPMTLISTASMKSWTRCWEKNAIGLEPRAIIMLPVPVPGTGTWYYRLIFEEIH